MQVTGKVVVVTGGGNGIGKAMCEAFHRAGAAKVVVADIDPGGARAVATPIGGRGLQMRCRKGEGHPSRHRGDRASVRPDRAVLLQCRHRRRLRSAVGECRRQLPTSRGAKLGRSCHGACLCGAASDPAHEGARRRLFPQHDFGGGPAVAGRQPGLFDHQACGGRLCRESRRSRTRPTTSRFRSCARRASTPTCCARSRRARNPATATCRRSRWRRTC